MCKASEKNNTPCKTLKTSCECRDKGMGSFAICSAVQENPSTVWRAPHEEERQLSALILEMMALGDSQEIHAADFY